MAEPATKVIGSLALTRAFAPVIRDNGGGAIVSLASLPSLAPIPQVGTYSGSKAALHSLMMSLRSELDGSGVSVLSVLPAFSETDMTAGIPQEKLSPEALALAVIEAVEGDAAEEYLNPMGMVHGGWTMALLDSALLCAVQTVRSAGDSYTSMGTEMKFIRPVLPTAGQLRGRAEVVTRGQRSATAQARVEDISGRLLASGTTTCFIFAGSAEPAGKAHGADEHRVDGALQAHGSGRPAQKTGPRRVREAIRDRFRLLGKRGHGRGRGLGVRAMSSTALTGKVNRLRTRPWRGPPRAVRGSSAAPPEAPQSRAGPGSSGGR